jgi:thiol-disulfide isomerase/thioredoxin
MRTLTALLACVGLPGLALGAASFSPAAGPVTTETAAARQEKPPAEPAGDEKKGYTCGSLVRRDLALPVLDGEPEPKLVFGPLEDLETPPIVLVWWSLRDPLCRKAEPKLEKLAAEYAPKGVRFYLVESNHDELVAGLGDPLDKVRKLRADLKLTLPLLIDRDNKVADEFAALCSNQVFVIDAHRVVRFNGSIDNDPENRPGIKVEPYLREALDLALEFKSPEFDLRRPQGRRLKRAPQDEAAAPDKPGKPARNG